VLPEVLEELLVELLEELVVVELLLLVVELLEELLEDAPLDEVVLLDDEDAPLEVAPLDEDDVDPPPPPVPTMVSPSTPVIVLQPMAWRPPMSSATASTPRLASIGRCYARAGRR
jgi:hypothetical protein